MEDVSVIGVDLAKSVFQVHGADARGEVVVRQRLTRASCCRSLPGCRAASSAWRPAQVPTTGRENGPRGAVDAAAIREALCEAVEERRFGCRGDL